MRSIVHLKGEVVTTLVSHNEGYWFQSTPEAPSSSGSMEGKAVSRHYDQVTLQQTLTRYLGITSSRNKAAFATSVLLGTLYQHQSKRKRQGIC